MREYGKVDVKITYEAYLTEWDCPHCGRSNSFYGTSSDASICEECGLQIEAPSGATEEYEELDVIEAPEDEEEEDE